MIFCNFILSAKFKLQLSAFNYNGSQPLCKSARKCRVLSEYKIRFFPTILFFNNDEKPLNSF